MDLSDVIQRGLAAARPAATAVPIGTLYYSTDTAVTERSNGTSWETYSDAGSVSGITQLTGDITAGPGSGSQTATIANDAVTYAKIQNVTDARLLGRAAGSAGDVQEITVGSGLSLASGNLTASGGASEWTTEVTKGTDQDVVNSATLVDDTALQLAVVANDLWNIVLYILYSATDASKDFLWDVAVSSGNMSGAGMYYNMGVSDAAGVAGLAFAEITNSANIISGTAAAHGVRAFKIDLTVLFSATGTFTFRFAENSIGSGTEARCKAGSRLRAKRLNPA